MPPKFKTTRFVFLTGVVIFGVILSSQYYRPDYVHEEIWKGLNFAGKNEIGKEGEKSPTLPFDWSSVTPSKDLRWTPCYTERQCARLSVPMDHHNPGGKQAVIALIRKPSPLGPDHPDYRGPILFNPGGPGGSGIELLANAGDLFASILGPRFDLVSFDPRGVGASIPRASFYRSNFERLLWGTGLSVISDDGVAGHWAKMKVINAMTEENDDGGLRYINTDQTARDMLSIVNAHGRDKLQYWGFSYGTVLGSTFAAMFPDKVERLIIDGVCDAEDYYATLWSKNLMDTDKGIDVFVSHCHEAGPVGCHFWAPTDTDIRHNMTKLFDNVRKEPVAVASATGLHGVVDINLLDVVTFQALYKPYAIFPLLAEAYAALAQGDGSIILSMAGGADHLKCPAESNTKPIPDATPAILCNDGEEVPSDLESTQKYLAMMKEASPRWGPIWSNIRMSCINWPKFPKTNFRGPFNATTKHPLLVIGNTADPVTPLWAAKKMSAGFAGSVVLTQDSPGHCSISAPSTCTQSYIRKYFIDGTLPEPGTVCPTDVPVFADQHGVPVDGAQQSFSAEERVIYDAIRELSKKGILKGLYPPMR